MKHAVWYVPLAAVGVGLATYLSWDRNHSLGYGIIHGILDWSYVVWWLFTR